MPLEDPAPRGDPRGAKWESAHKFDPYDMVYTHDKKKYGGEADGRAAAVAPHLPSVAATTKDENGAKHDATDLNWSSLGRLRMASILPGYNRER